MITTQACKINTVSVTYKQAIFVFSVQVWKQLVWLRRGYNIKKILNSFALDANSSPIYSQLCLAPCTYNVRLLSLFVIHKVCAFVRRPTTLYTEDSSDLLSTRVKLARGMSTPMHSPEDALSSFCLDEIRQEIEQFQFLVDKSLVPE